MTTARFSPESPSDWPPSPRSPQKRTSLRALRAPWPIFVVLLAACSGAAPREAAEPLFRALEIGSPAEALAAGEKLASVYDDSELPRLAKALDAAPVRTLQLIGELSTDGSA